MPAGLRQEMMKAGAGDHAKQRLADIFGDVRLRRHLYRATIVLLLLAAAFLVYAGATARLSARGIGTGFGFLFQEAGFAIGETLPIPIPEGGCAWLFLALCAAGIAGLLIRTLAGGTGLHWPWLAGGVGLLALVGAVVLIVQGRSGVGVVNYSAENSFGFALATGFANTIKVSIFGVLLATVIGLTVGIARLSSNWLVARSATAFVESLRNIPLLVQVFFWYFGVLRALPSVRQSLDLGGTLVLNSRGVYLPHIHATVGSWPDVLALLAGIAGATLLRRRALAVKLATGLSAAWSPAVPLLPLFALAIAWFVFGAPATLSFPVLSGFNYVGGVRLSPEFASLMLGLGFYHASFIAEIVRAGIQGVDHGQREAARSLGFREGRILRLIIFPQALRVMFPPLITQYLSLIKDSSLGFAIAYPELVTINNVTINQTGQPIEVLMITISVYMAFNLLVSLILNRFERAYSWAWG